MAQVMVDAGGVATAGPCTDADCWWSSDGADSCRSFGVPTQDDRPNDEGVLDAVNVDSIAPIYLGFTDVRLGTNDADGQLSEDAWQDVGFDVDGRCTNSSTCRTNGGPTCRSPGPELPFDGKLCRDNTFSRLLALIAVGPELTGRFALTESSLNCQLWRGSFNMVARISNYNGKPNDGHVRVDFYMSTGLEETPSWTCPSDDDYRAFPHWRSGRPWGIDMSSLAGAAPGPGALPDSMFADVDAYVKDGYLVARVPEGTEQGFMGDSAGYRGFMFRPSQGVFLGYLQQAQDDTWEMSHGLIGGRIRKEELIHAFHLAGFCESADLHTFYQSMTHFVDDMADVLANGQIDPNSNCDAMSYAIGFNAAQITPGTVTKAPPRIECCTPGKSVDECLASCGDGVLNGDEKCDTAIALGSPGACPTQCPVTSDCTPQLHMGTGCSAICVPMQISMAGAKDGCCPQGAAVTQDGDCAARCGNGVIEPGETCDPGTSCRGCESTNSCLMARTLGSADTCNLQCEYTTIRQCGNGDGCCPAGCTSDTDNDCSTTCGNGAIDKGETCEANSDQPCRASCDDGDPCTQDERTGSIQNCNVTCTNTPITQAVSGDKCCLPGMSANVDSDCSAVCGNRLVERDEQCDDGNDTTGDGCDHCKIESQQKICSTNIGGTDSCAKCTCAKCTDQAIACYGNRDQHEAELCRNLVQCSLQTKCSNPDCLCGSASLFSCLAGGGNGPCKKQISEAAESDSLIDIDARATDPTYPLGLGNTLHTCIVRNCANECDAPQ